MADTVGRSVSKATNRSKENGATNREQPNQPVRHASRLNSSADWLASPDTTVADLVTVTKPKEAFSFDVAQAAIEALWAKTEDALTWVELAPLQRPFTTKNC